jgi:hypothetical protein
MPQIQPASIGNLFIKSICISKPMMIYLRLIGIVQRKIYEKNTLILLASASQMM